jgi:RNA polymerase sigma factor (sigma-70 family)
LKVSLAVVDGFKHAQPEAIKEVYLAYKSLVYFLIVSIVKNEEDAKDIYQDTFVEAIQSAPSLKNPKGFESYLTTIATHKALNFVRQKSHQVDIGSLLDIYGEEESHNSLLLEMHDYLTDLENIMVTYHIYYGYGFRDISKLTNVPSSSCHQIYKKALGKIKAHLGGEKDVQ